MAISPIMLLFWHPSGPDVNKPPTCFNVYNPGWCSPFEQQMWYVNVNAYATISALVSTNKPNNHEPAVLCNQ